MLLPSVLISNPKTKTVRRVLGLLGALFVGYWMSTDNIMSISFYDREMPGSLAVELFWFLALTKIGLTVLVGILIYRSIQNPRITELLMLLGYFLAWTLISTWI